MSIELLTVEAAAKRLGITPATLYDWLGQADYGSLLIRGTPVEITYYQGGPRGQGRIRIPETEVERLLELMRVKPRTPPLRRPPSRPLTSFPGINVPLGRPTR
jgi:transposase-like protein